MKNWNRLSNQATRRIIPTACATALAVAFAVSLPAHAGKVTPPRVPDELKVEDGTHAFLVGHALGTQNYGHTAFVPYTADYFFYTDQ